MPVVCKTWLSNTNSGVRMSISLVCLIHDMSQEAGMSQAFHKTCPDSGLAPNISNGPVLKDWPVPSISRGMSQGRACPKGAAIGCCGGTAKENCERTARELRGTVQELRGNCEGHAREQWGNCGGTVGELHGNCGGAARELQKNSTRHFKRHNERTHERTHARTHTHMRTYVRTHTHTF